MVQRGSRQSTFVNELGEMRRHAESGINLALHELTYDVGGQDGIIGTEAWTAANDLGKDGLAGTFDEGESDGIPTPGEPNLNPAPIGRPELGMRLLVWSTDTAWPGIKRLVATAYHAGGMAVVEVFVRAGVGSIPEVGAVYAQPGVTLDLRGNSFVISGNDTNPDGTAGPRPPIYGIGTAVGDPAGSNASGFADQVPTGREDQIIGLGGLPSIGESTAMDFDQLFNAFKAGRENVVAPGSYTDVAWGNFAAADHTVTYCNGDLHLSGDGSGSGVLVVEGSLTLAGRFEFAGVVIVRGDVRLTGGGSGIHIYGGLLIGQTLTAFDPDPALGVTGNADVFFSSAALAAAAGLLGSTYSV
ncbi:MAG: hypothetical protein ACRD0M_11790, partial [Acidimicrobiales bacterium]